MNNLQQTALLPSSSEWSTMLQMAEALFKSGLLPAHIKSPQAALAVVQKGRELSVPPMYALSNISVISGKPAAGAELMLALVYRDHGDDAVHFVETTEKACTIQYKRRGWSSYSSFSFSIDDATRAGLTQSPNWSKYPAAMLRARCVSAVARMAFPDTIAGMYTPEELGAPVLVDAETGEIGFADVVQPPGIVEGQVREVHDNGHATAETGMDARASYSKRIKHHAAVLGLNKARLAELLRVMAGGRAPKQLSTSELGKLAEDVERISSADEVDAVIKSPDSWFDQDAEPEWVDTVPVAAAAKSDEI